MHSLCRSVLQQLGPGRAPRARQRGLRRTPRARPRRRAAAHATATPLQARPPRSAARRARSRGRRRRARASRARDPGCWPGRALRPPRMRARRPWQSGARAAALLVPQGAPSRLASCGWRGRDPAQRHARTARLPAAERGAAGCAHPSTGHPQPKHRRQRAARSLRKMPVEDPTRAGRLGGRRLRRAPQEADPEAVLLNSGLDAGTVAAFLHENALHFVADAAIADAADVLAYFSDAGARLTPARHTRCRVLQRTAASDAPFLVAVCACAHRGLFGGPLPALVRTRGCSCSGGRPLPAAGTDGQCILRSLEFT